MFVQLATVQAKERMTVLFATNAKELVAIQNSTGMTIMSKQIDALKLAFEALKENQHLVADNERHAYVMEYNSIIEKCEEALAKPQQEPATKEQIREAMIFNLPLYTTPPQRKPLVIDSDEKATKHMNEKLFEFLDIAMMFPKAKADLSVWERVIIFAPQRTWVGLTDEEIDELHGSPMDLEHSSALKWVRIIEAKLKEKNT